ncbi:hypothetical protein B5U98_24095 [Bosea sp. Tri-39]|nr:hypothetical protein BLM15_08940 [Bosea sp. Tri-49]RXT18342.1 hypothetical protein B5U98_24095 [Bosea sp. Tri-39]RXT32938.1 hypothetical protein B5U99_30440 [Bosea sp. Tri-54]
MWTVSRIAERDGVTRQAISKHVARMVEHHSLDVSRDSRGRVSAVNIVHFDDLRRRFGDSGKVRAADAERSALPSESEPKPGSDDTLDGTRRIKILYEIEGLRLRQAEEAGALLRKDMIEDGLDRLAEEIGRIVDLPQHADVIAAAAGKSLHELRIVLKRLTIEMRTAISAQAAALAAAAPQRDAALPEGSS